MGGKSSKNQTVLTSKQSTNRPVITTQHTSNRVGNNVVNEYERRWQAENTATSTGNRVYPQYGDPNYLVNNQWQKKEIRIRHMGQHQQNHVETALVENASPVFICQQRILLEHYKQNVPKNQSEQKEVHIGTGDPCQQKKMPHTSVSSIPNSQFGCPDHLVQINLQHEELKKRLNEYHQRKDMNTASIQNCTRTDTAEIATSTKFINRQQLLSEQYNHNVPQKLCQLQEITSASNDHVLSSNNSQYGNSGYLVQKSIQEKEDLRKGLKEQHQQKLMETASTKHSTRMHSLESPASVEFMHQQKPFSEHSICEKNSWQRQWNLSTEKHQEKLLPEQYKEKVVDKKCKNNFKEEKQEKDLKKVYEEFGFEEQRRGKVTERECQENKQKKLREKKFMKEITKLHSLAVAQTKCLVPVSSRHLSHAVLKNHLATNWNEMPPNKTFVRIVIQEDSDEYRTVKNCFQTTTQKIFHVVKIERIQNPFLLGCYMLKKLELENMFGAHNVNEMIVFRGSFARFIDNVCENNFNWKFYGDSRDRGYGKGIYFSPISFYANNYSDKDTTNKVMFLVRVVVSKIIQGNGTMKIPPPVGRDTGNNNSNNSLRYDTTKRPDGKIMVKYTDNDFYPEYLIHYTVESQPEMM